MIASGKFGCVRLCLRYRVNGRHFSSPSCTEVDTSKFHAIKYEVKDRVARITLNRPEALNAINEEMPRELLAAVEAAEFDRDVKMLLVSGAGSSFCAGYDLRGYGERSAGEFACIQTMPWDPHQDYQYMSYCSKACTSLWKCTKPSICRIHGYAVGGGSDLALSCDLTIMSSSAQIGYPPARVWGCPTTAMWPYRLPAELAKRILFTGKLLTGDEAYRLGLVGDCVADDELDAGVELLIEQMIEVPSNQLFFHKMMINGSVEARGLSQTQAMATLFDGMARHSPEGVRFQERMVEVGFKRAVRERDSWEPTVWSDMKK